MPASLLPADLQLFQRGWLSSNNLLCLGERPALVDTGHDKHAELTLHLVQTALLGQPPLHTIAHTHLHGDHCGGTAVLQAAYPEARTLVAASSWDTVQQWDEQHLTYELTGQHCRRFAADGVLQPGSTVQLGNHVWEIHATAGHDSDAVMLFEPKQRLLLAGDALWQNQVSIVFDTLPRFQRDGFAGFEATLDRIERLQPQVVVPGHGAVFGEVDGSVTAAIASARKRLALFRAQPDQHARYAAKALIKYQLLDVEHMTHEGFRQWLAGAPVFAELHNWVAGSISRDAWLADILDELERKDALWRSETEIGDSPTVSRQRL